MAISNIHRYMMIKTIVLFLVVFGVGLIIIGQIHDEVIVICQFSNMTQKFETTKREAERNSMMITVHKGSRTFMFLREGLSACYVENETS